ncbi:MAG: DUF4215 domain-containing protein, partial [Myxococcales bacterium]|nr:DUF4215 domain-containing protein [Myxococcales bacterium]
MNRVWIAIACCLTVTSIAGRAAAACGDFRIDMGEACDDGNVASGDGCSSMCAVESGFVCENISFQLSTVQDLGAGGVTPNWVLDADNRGVLETTNSHAGVYSTIIPADIGEIVFDVRVEQTGDNDFIGWTIGYDMGEISTTSTPVGTDFLLFSWKQGQQNSGGNRRHSGLGLSRVTGPGSAGQYWVGNGGGLTMIAESTNYPIDDSLANNGETVNGWDDNRWYRVNMIVTSTRVQVWIREGNTTNTTNPANRGFPALNRTTHLEFDVTTAIPTGNFGLYAYSQPNVRFDLVNPESDSDCARDYDADGIRDSRDLDSDRDGVLDLLEMPGFTSDPDNDTDLDGIPDWRDPNNIPGGCTASMGVCTTLPAAFDVDGDGIPNHLDRDSDGDGLPDTTEVGLTDVNRDGTPDACTMVTTVGVCVAGGLGNAVPVDTDGRGGANFLDRDSDSDGIPDSVEAGLTDANRDGVPDACTMVTSFGLCVSGGLVMGATLPNTDGVGLPDYADRDADGDGLTDAREAGLTDANGDGIPDTCVSDTAAGLCVAGGLVGALPNTNSAGPVDYVDSDSDGDGITDRNEAYDTNGNQMANIVPTGVDTDADGIDNAYDPSCVLMVCGMTIGAPVLGVLTVAQDANQDGRPDWLTVCGDAYVTGSEPCDDGNLVNNDTCTNMCLVTLTNPCTGNAQCDSGTCNAGTMTCSTCVNNSPTGTDTGCTAATPACIFTGLNSMCVQCDVNAQCPGGVCSPTNLCEVCIDSGAGTDTGCSAATPNCIGASGSRMCVQCTSAAQCNDNVACTTDACTANACVNTPVASGGAGGCAGGQVCSGAPTNTCVTCTDTSPTGTDAGCMNAAPHCRTSGNGAPVCEPCLDTVMGSGMDLGCGAATPYCVAGSGGNSCVACLTGADCGDGNTCTQDVCTAGVCSNPPVSVGTS